MSRGPDAGTLLIRALAQSAANAGCPVTLTGSHWRRWASATFTGARHTLSLHASACPALDGWIAALPETELHLHGHLLADMTVIGLDRDGDHVVLTLEALTLEDR